MHTARQGAARAEAFAPAGAVVHAHGELDLQTAPELRQVMRDVIDGGAKRLVVDLREVTFIDSVALAAVIHAGRELGYGRLAIVSASDSYATLIVDVAGLRKLVACVETVEQGIAAVTG